MTWTAPKDGLVAGGANHEMRGLEPSVSAPTSGAGGRDWKVSQWPVTESSVMNE